MNYKEKYYQHHNLDKCDVLECAVCGKLATNLHHILYKSQGGKDDESNLIPLCYNCHANHHDRNSPTTEQLKNLKHENI